MPAAAAPPDRPPAPEPSVPVVEASAQVPNNLPRPLSSFVGRGDDVRRVARACAESRLVTLTGPGGAGKTRLAREAAAALAADPAAYPDGVWWVELAPLAARGEPGDAAQVLASAVGVRPSAEGDLDEALARAMGAWPSRRALAGRRARGRA